MVPEVLRSCGSETPEVQFDLNQLFRSTSENGHYRSPFLLSDSGDGRVRDEADFGGLETDVGLYEASRIARRTLMDGADGRQSMDVSLDAPSNVASAVDSLWHADCTTMTSSDAILSGALSSRA